MSTFKSRIESQSNHGLIINYMQTGLIIIICTCKFTSVGTRVVTCALFIDFYFLWKLGTFGLFLILIMRFLILHRKNIYLLFG